MDILIVNINEAEAISNKKINNIEDVKNISKILNKKFKLVIITAGQDGVVGSEENQDPIYLPSEKIKVKSTHGAGDVFAGVFCAAIASNEDLAKALNIANKKAAFHVAK